MKVQINAKTNFINAAIIVRPLKSAITVAITAIAKYIFAGVQSLLKSFIYTISIYFYFKDKKNGFLNLLTKGILLNNIELEDLFIVFLRVLIPLAKTFDELDDVVFFFP